MTDDTKRTRKRVLLLAYACSPYRGSEPGVGWHRATETAKYFDTWVICEKHEFEDDIRRYFEEHGEIPGLHFCFIPGGARFGKFLRTGMVSWGLWFVKYNLWHRWAYRVAVELHRELRFDLVHQVNMCTFREPGYLWRLNVPFIWGPVGGTQNYPWRFLRYAGIKAALKEGLRNILNTLQFRFSYRVRKTVRRAAVLLTANSTGRHDFKRIHNVKAVLMLETGVAAVADEVAESGEPQGPLRILWSGGGLHKALHLLIIALSKVPDSVPYELRILGKGALEKRWRRLAQRTGVDPHCTWMGWLPHDEAMAQYDWADLLGYTSLRDTSGNVVLEALSRGVPVICLDHQGVGDIVTNKCGIKIPVTTPDEVVSRLRDAIVYLAENRNRLQALSRGAIERAREYLWSRHGERMAEIYEEILAAHTGQVDEQSKEPERISAEAARPSSLHLRSKRQESHESR